MYLCERDLSKKCDGKYRDCIDCVLDNIRDDIVREFFSTPTMQRYAVDRCLEIIYKYKTKSQEKKK